MDEHGRSWPSLLRLPNTTFGGYVRVALAEFLGTCILLAIGIASVAQCVLSRKEDGNFLSINFGWGIGVAMGAYACSGVSGGHLNPAISLAMCLIGRLSWKKLPFYLIGQFVGAFVGAAIAYGVYYEAINKFDEGVRAIDGPTGTASIFATYPKEDISQWQGLVDQVVCTGFLAICVMAIGDPRNAGVPPSAGPLLVGLLVAALSGSFGYNCGIPINPARDLSPRLFTAIAGWGFDVFSYREYWFWIPIVGPILGAILGAVLYLLLIGFHWPPKDCPANSKKSPDEWHTKDRRRSFSETKKKLEDEDGGMTQL